MFSYIRGTLEEISAESVTVETMGVGWKLTVPSSVFNGLPAIGKEVKLYTSFQVREDDMTLYGFLTSNDRNMFELLLLVNGIGPKAAMGLLSCLSPDELRMAIVSEDEKAIARAPGIGAKTAKRVILDLKDRIDIEDLEGDGLAPAAQSVASSAPVSVKETIEALVSLGYSLSDATKAARCVENADELSTQAVLKEALKHLSTL